MYWKMEVSLGLTNTRINGLTCFRGATTGKLLDTTCVLEPHACVLNCVFKNILINDCNHLQPTESCRAKPDASANHVVFEQLANKRARNQWLLLLFGN